MDKLEILLVFDGLLSKDKNPSSRVVIMRVDSSFDGSTNTKVYTTDLVFRTFLVSLPFCYHFQRYRFNLGIRYNIRNSGILYLA